MIKKAANERGAVAASPPMVTIVTPSFNQGRFITDTILSVLDQDYSAIEYLVMDGGSADETLDILNAYSDRLFFVSEKDRGQAHAINKGFQRARGDFLAFLNSDDTYLPGAVSAAVKALLENPEAPFVYGEGYLADESGQVFERYPTEQFSDDRLRETCFICQPTVFIRREALEKTGYLDEQLHFCLDYELWTRLCALGQPVYIEQFLARARVHPLAKSVCQRRALHLEAARMWKRKNGYVPDPWIFGLAQAVAETRLNLDRSKRIHNGLFVLAISCLLAGLALYFNHRVGASERRLIVSWMSSAAKGVFRGILRYRAGIPGFSSKS